MSLTLLLPWFPILLGVGVGGRLLGRTRGYGLGLLCALFWMVLVQATGGPAIWGDPWAAATIVAGAVAIIAMGGWAGETLIESDRSKTGSAGQSSVASSPPTSGVNAVRGLGPAEACGSLERLASALDQFDDWLEEHRNDGNPWPKFDDFIRQVCYNACQATHVKPYRVANEGEELLPLHEPDPLAEVFGDGLPRPLSARRGILGYVITSGRSYYAGDAMQGELVAKLAEQSLQADSSTEPIVWCFPIKQGTRRVGVVAVRHLGIPPDGHKQLLRAVEGLISQFWCALAEVCYSRAAVQDDPISGLYTREAFLRAAEHSLNESYAQGEPVALAVIAIENLRALSDSGRWEVADELVREVSNTLRRKVRMDDQLGRFDGSRLLLLLRRVDSELATLIVTQVMSRLKDLCEDQARWRASIGVRCGVVGSGAEQPGLRTLVSQALSRCHRARIEGLPIVSDVEPIDLPATDPALRGVAS